MSILNSMPNMTVDLRVYSSPCMCFLCNCRSVTLRAQLLRGPGLWVLPPRSFFCRQQHLVLQRGEYQGLLWQAPESSAVRSLENFARQGRFVVRLYVSFSRGGIVRKGWGPGTHTCTYCSGVISTHAQRYIRADSYRYLLSSFDISPSIFCRLDYLLCVSCSFGHFFCLASLCVPPQIPLWRSLR